MNTERGIFDDCGAETEFSRQWFRADPNGMIVNTDPPTATNDATGIGEVRYIVSEILPEGFDYIGKDIGVLTDAAKSLSLRLRKPRKKS